MPYYITDTFEPIEADNASEAAQGFVSMGFPPGLNLHVQYIETTRGIQKFYYSVKDNETMIKQGLVSVVECKI
ncbi:hypothetical protein HW115_01745 [Verrucomicrobiaceae bacterium N1E253]|uniref:Uncharacterized protein n=1 Tax=Oceaniferula marina TaxID=2748318 RepID=A0A851GGQ1_9BACT|nr:hypothetical protein [Oceaniferula marina]NWK54317.1 hypothetical protein [Oceaniferula marina]